MLASALMRINRLVVDSDFPDGKYVREFGWIIPPDDRRCTFRHPSGFKCHLFRLKTDGSTMCYAHRLHEPKD